MKKFGKLPAIVPASSQAIGLALIKSVTKTISKDTELAKAKETHRLMTDILPYADLGADARIYVSGGACMFGLHEKGTDLDLNLICDNFAPEQGKDPAPSPGDAAASQFGAARQTKSLQSKAIGNVQMAIRIRHPVWRADEVKKTRLPVLRVLGGPQPFDINVNKHNVVKSSTLLRQYFLQYPEGRWLALAIKKWSMRAGINHDKPHGYLSTTGFNMLVAYYLRSRGLVKHIPVDSLPSLEQIDQVPPAVPLEDPANPTELGDQVKDFLNFYLHEFDLETQVVSLEKEGAASKESLLWTKDEEQTMGSMGGMTGGKLAYRLCIEDPFQTSQNIGRFVSAFKFAMLRLHFNKAIGDGCGFLIPEDDNA